jgi:hypothetical protein
MSLLNDILAKFTAAIGITNAVNITSLQDNFFASGQSFTLSHDYTFTTSETKNFLVDPTGYVPPEGGQDRVVANVPSFAASAGPLKVEFFVGTTVSANGTQQTTFNRDATSSNVAQTCIYLAPTITDDGTGFSELLIPATAGGPVNVGSNSPIDLPFAMDSTLKLLMRVTNENGADTRVGIRFTFFEI